MAELLLRGQSVSRANPAIDRQCFKKGFPVSVFDDGHVYGTKECPPDFAVLAIPMVPKEKVIKYLTPEFSVVTPGSIYRIRKWKVLWETIPPAAHDKLFVDGRLTIKATDLYTGPYDYTWQQIKVYFYNQRTEQSETEDL